ncbi:hypothetical protein NQ314_002767, partial [Rhamnusium bicolor]
KNGVENLQQKLSKVKSVCITIDHWRSSANESYIGVTAHYIDDQFEMCSSLLQCSLFEGSHTATAIADELRMILDHWNLTQKTLITITDNASNVTSAIEKVLVWKHYGCFAHKLNLVVNSALDIPIVANVVKKIKVVVSHFKRSSQATEKLLKMQIQLGSNSKLPLRLLQDVVTRWNSTFLLIARFRQLQEAVRSTVANLDILSAPNLQMLSEDEWKIAAEMCILLEPFE